AVRLTHEAEANNNPRTKGKRPFFARRETLRHLFLGFSYRRAMALQGTAPAELAALRLHTGLEGLAREVGQCDPNDDLRCPAVVGHSGHLRKMLASFAPQLSGRGVLMER